jgi:vacuolar-type H+-ATPase subunit E/Vma4
MKARLDEIKRQEQALSKNVEKYKEKIKLIKDEDKIDKDLLEEIIYDMLNMTDEDYKILSD